MPNEDQKLDSLLPGSGGNGKSSLRRPKLSTRKFSAWKKKKKKKKKMMMMMKIMMILITIKAYFPQYLVDSTEKSRSLSVIQINFLYING